MSEPCLMLNRMIASFAARGIQCGIWPHDHGWVVWIGNAEQGRVASAWLEVFSAIAPWLEEQVREHYGIDRRGDVPTL